MFFIDGFSEVLFSGRTYFLQLHSGDLRLYSDFGKGPKQYWSVQQTLAKNVDLRQVAYASKSALKSCCGYASETYFRV